MDHEQPSHPGISTRKPTLTTQGERAGSNHDLITIWDRAARSPGIDRVIHDVHEDLARATFQRKPRCISSGRCCRFESFGHRLYTTGLEVAWTLSRLASMDRSLTGADVIRAQQAGTCPFLVDHLCSIHTIRPMGCRVFFCDESATDWQRDLYEQSQARIRAIHETHEIPYEYREWRSLLARFTRVPARPEAATAPDSRVLQLRIAR